MICEIEGCNEPVQSDNIPVWKEYRLFGHTWVFGKYQDEYLGTLCAECVIIEQQDHERDQIEPLLEEMGRKAYEEGYADGLNKY